MDSDLRTETDRHFDDAFIEDSDQNSTTLDNSSEAIIDKNIRLVHNSSIAIKEKIASDCQDILHWPLENLSSSDNFCIWEIAGVTPKPKDKNCIWETASITPKSANKNCIWETSGITPKSADKNCIWEIAGITPKSADKNCIWEIAGITPKSTERDVCISAKQAIMMNYSTTAMSPPDLKESPLTISTVPKYCTGSTIIPQKSTLGAQNDIVNTDNHCRGERGGKRHLQARSRFVKKRAWKQKDVPLKRRCINPSDAIVRSVSLKDCPSSALLDSKGDLIKDKCFLLTSVTWPNSSSAQDLPLNSTLETNNDVVNTENRVKNERLLGPISKKKLLADSMKTVKKWTKNVPRKRKCTGQLVDETFASRHFLPESKTCAVKLSSHSDETVCLPPRKNKTIQTNDVSDNVINWTALPASDECLQSSFCDLTSSSSDAYLKNYSWRRHSGEKLISLESSNSVLANKATEPCSDENAVLTDELKNWEPFSTSTLCKTDGAMTEDAEMALQDTLTSDANLARKKNRRKSVSADREIASQMVVIPSPEKSDSSLAFSHKRYPQRLRRRSTEPLQFTQIEPFSYVEAPAAALNKGSVTEPEMHLGSESLANADDMRLCSENTVRPGDELALDFDASVLDSDFNPYPVPAKRSRALRRKSTELFRLSMNNQNQPLAATLEQVPEQQEFTSSQKVQNDIANMESKVKENGTKKLSRCPKKKKGKTEEGPSLEDIYLNRLWRSQMPKDTLWETIPEDPKYNKETGGLRLFSVRKAKRFLDFDEGPSLSHLKKRKLKAMKNGWKPITKKREIALSNLLEKKLSQLDKEIGVI